MNKKKTKGKEKNYKEIREVKWMKNGGEKRRERRRKQKKPLTKTSEILL